jgi:phosphogluconate dehydratase
MGSGLANAEKTRVREQFALGRVDRAALMEAEAASYHSPGTCTFYGTANSNQMLLEAMGLHVPGAAFIHPSDGLRDALTKEAVRLVLANASWPQAAAGGEPRFLPIGRLVDERSIVNAMVALLATGGSTNHLIHWVAVARSAGIVIDWSDFSDLSRRDAAAGAGLSQRQRRREPVPGRGRTRLRHPRADRGRLPARRRRDRRRRRPRRLHPRSRRRRRPARVASAAAESGDATIIRRATDPFSEEGGLKLLAGNCGRAVIKVSSVPADRWVVEAPALVFDSQEEMLAAFAAGALERDFVAVVRFQGPRANGMPELHKLTPPLGALQKKGFRVALVTDGRMSGASGQVPAAIHVSPEVLAGGPLGRVRSGDVIRVDAHAGTLVALVDAAEWQQARACDAGAGAGRGETATTSAASSSPGMRKNVVSAEEGACTWL